MTLKEAIEILRQSGVDSPEYDAREIFKHFANLDNSDITIGCASSDDVRLTDAIKRRASREPLQYIIGTVGFYREEYEVSPDCLIPRYDTEILVDYAVKHIPRGESFADLCCGSGCIGISTLANTQETRCLFADVSEAAIELTKINAKKNGVASRTMVSVLNLLEDGSELCGEYYAILSNPPYIPEAVYRGLESEIFHEPKIAFVGGESGLVFYEKLLPLALKYLKTGGFIAFEIGYDQGEALTSLAGQNACSCEILKDYSGNDRVAVLKRL